MDRYCEVQKKEEETESLFRVNNADSICWTLGAMHSRDIKGVPGEGIEMLLSVSNQTLLGRRAIAEYWPLLVISLCDKRMSGPPYTFPAFVPQALPDCVHQWCPLVKYSCRLQSVD